MEFKSYIASVSDGVDLSGEEAERAMEMVMDGEATPAQVASFLTALKMKGETVEEISAFARVMRKFATRISPKVDGLLVDTCGTGGDKVKTFNISTIAAFVASGAGVGIAKHGNRSVTSKSGSADLLEALGVKLELSPEKVEKLIEEVGIGFMFAPLFHKTMKHAVGPRKEIGIRTVFNILGPLTNPAEAQAQVLGVFKPELTEVMAGVLRNLGVKHALVIHGMEGLDELSIAGESRVSELRDGKIDTYTVTPEDFGIERAEISSVVGGSPGENARTTLSLLKDGLKGAERDIVLMNSAAAIYVGGRAETLEEGVELAEESIDSGEAYSKLKGLVESSVKL